MRRAVAAAALLACAGSAHPAANSTAPCDTSAAPVGMEMPAACANDAAFAASDLRECTSKPDVVRYVAGLRDALLHAIPVDCAAGPELAHLRLRIRRDGTLADPCVVGAPRRLAAEVLAGVEKVGRAPEPTGDVACLVGAPLNLYMTLQPEGSAR